MALTAPAYNETPTPRHEEIRSGAAPGAALRVALDLRRAAHPSIGRYITGLLGGFAALRAPIVWTMLGPRIDVPAGTQVERWVEPEPPRGRWSRRARVDLNYTDLLHLTDPEFPAVRAPRCLLTLHDLFDTQFGPWRRRLSRRFELQRLGARQVRVIATSTKVRDDLDARAAFGREAVSIVHPGPGLSDPPGLRAWQAGARSAQLAAPEARWFLTVSGDSPESNVDFLISAMALWYRRRPSAPPLIWAAEDEAQAAGRRMRIPAETRRHIQAIGVAEAGREQVFGGAAALIVPDLESSHAYGALEWMRRGYPVICARRRPFIDLLGNAPLWFDPKDSSTLWRSLDAFLDDGTLQRDMSERSRRESARYDWVEAAEMTLGAYRQLLRATPGGR